MAVVTLAERVAGEIRATMARERVSQMQLAERLEADASWVYRRLSGRSGLTLADVQDICEALDVEPAELLKAALA